MFDAQKTEALAWSVVRDSLWVWDFDDGGAGSEGIFAAHVYETAGTYNPTLTQDGEQWNVGEITVTDPTQINCVSLVSDWDGCPSATRYTSVGGGLSATIAGEMLLFHEGENYGTQALGGKANVAIGAYGDAGEGDVSAGKPAFTGTDWEGGEEQSWSDLDVTKAGGTIFSTGVADAAGLNQLVLRVYAHGSPDRGLTARSGWFVIDSYFNDCQDYCFYSQGNEKPIEFMVVKGTKMRLVAGGNHTLRYEEMHRGLIQDSSFYNNHDRNALRCGRGCQWILNKDNWLQGNFTNGETGYSTNYLITDGNILSKNAGSDPGGYAFASGADNILARNNIAYNDKGGFGLDCSPASDCTVVNNTLYGDTVGWNGGITIGGGTIKNNIVMQTGEMLNSISGGTGNSNNWVWADNVCQDPVDDNTSGGYPGGAECFDPGFISIDIGDDSWDPTVGDAKSWPDTSDVFRPCASGDCLRGVGIGNESVPVWTDFYGATRADIDVGAVER